MQVTGSHSYDGQMIGSDEWESGALGEWKQRRRIEIGTVDGRYVVSQCLTHDLRRGALGTDLVAHDEDDVNIGVPRMGTMVRYAGQDVLPFSHSVTATYIETDNLVEETHGDPAAVARRCNGGRS